MAVNREKALRITADPPWGWSAGLRHPPSADYEPGMFTAAQIGLLEQDEALTIVELDPEGEPLPPKPPKGGKKAA